MSYDHEKFKNLMHYVIHAVADRDGFGATKIYKVLWFSEARSFVLGAKPISGAAYIREKHGPVPRLGKAVRDELAREGKIEQWTAPYFNRISWRFKSLKSPFPLMLTDQEKSYVDYWIKHIDEEHTASSISEESHDYGWEIARMGEVLPFNAILASRVHAPEGKSLDRLRAKARDLGLT